MSNSQVPPEQIAVERLSRGDMDGAALIIEQLLEENPQNADALCLKGRIFFHRRQTNQALEWMEPSLAINRD